MTRAFRLIACLAAAALLFAADAGAQTPRPWSTSIWNSPDITTLTGSERIGLAAGLGMQRYTTPLEIAAFVGAQSPGVISFNTRGGIITLTASDVGGAITATAAAHQFFNSLGPNGVFGAAQPAIGDLQSIAASSVVGNAAGAPATPAALTQAQLTALLNPFTSTLLGAAPASGGGTANFLRADGVWATPGGGGNVTGPVSSVNNHVTTFNGVSGTNIQDSGIAIGSLLTANQTITLSGDCTGSGATSIVSTCGKVNGVSYPAGPSLHSTPQVTASNTVSYKVVPDCTDASGNHLNYTQSTDSYSCGTSNGVSVTAGNNGIVVTPTPGTNSFTVSSAAPSTTQTTSYTIATTDLATVVWYNSASAGIFTVPQAIGSFGAKSMFCVGVRGAGALTLSPVTSTIYGLTSLVGVQNQFACLVSDGINWGGIGTFGLAGSGTVTSVGVTGTGGLTASPSPIVGAGTITLNAFTSSLPGGVPASGGGTTNFLRADGTWAAAGGGSTTIIKPQGRLTLTANTPVMTADATAQATVRYDCYAGNQVPVYNGSTSSLLTIPSCELTLPLDATNATNNGLFDVFAFSSSGTLKLCFGPAWAAGTGGSNTARGTGAGSTSIHNTVTGYWTNAVALSNCWNNSVNQGSIAADLATYVGTFWTTAAGQTGMQFKAAANTPGTGSSLGLYNGYNRVRIVSRQQDAQSTWGSSTSSWHAANVGNAANDKITYVDGLQQSNVDAKYTVTSSSAATGNHCEIGIDLDSTSATPADALALSDIATNLQLMAGGSFTPQMGLHFLQAMEDASSAAACTFTGSFGAGQVAQLSISLEM